MISLIVFIRLSPKREIGSRGSEEERHLENKDKEGTEKNTNTGPEGYSENTVEVDCDTRLDGKGPDKVTELNGPGDSL